MLSPTSLAELCQGIVCRVQWQNLQPYPRLDTNFRLIVPEGRDCCMCVREAQGVAERCQGEAINSLFLRSGCRMGWVPCCQLLHTLWNVAHGPLSQSSLTSDLVFLFKSPNHL